MGAPETRYAMTVDGVHIAYQVLGEGNTDLVIHFPWLQNIDAIWDVPDFVTLLRGFGRFARVILFDRRGLGVSDRPTSLDVMAIEKGMEDLRAVLDEVGSERTALLGYEAGGTVMLLFAASHPERVTALGLVTPRVCYWSSADFPWGYTEEEAAEEWEWERDHWGTAEYWLWLWPGISDRPISREEAVMWARYSRSCMSPAGALAVDEVERQIDVRAVLPQIQVPTLVMRSRGDSDREGHGAAEWVAEQIPGARYAELDSGDHLPLRPEVYRPFEEFLSQIREREAVFDRVLATVLFTDIVDSTQMATQLGDRAWGDVVERHHAITRSLLARFRGTEVDTAGDGFFATFDGPARAVTCAMAILDSVGHLGIEVRAGVHTGEVQTIAGKTSGMAVVIGARVGALATGSGRCWRRRR